MFSNELNTRDLMFSNPMDNFFGQDHEIKTSFESGFSSTYSGYNRTGNSKELQYRSSQDLFSQTERADSPFTINNSDYQNYISQNLLLGRNDKSPKSIFTRQKDNTKEVAEEKHQFDENEMKDIKKSLDILNENIKKISSEVVSQNAVINSLQDETSKLNKKITSIENSIAKAIKHIDESHKDVVSIIKKGERDKKKLYDMVSKNADNINCLVNKVDDCIQQNEENVKKYMKTFTHYETENEKQLKSLFSKVDYTFERCNKFLNTSVKSIQDNFGTIIEQKLGNLKSCTKNDANELVPSPDFYVTKSPVHKTRKYPQSKVQNSTYTNNIFKDPTSLPNENSDYNYGNNNELRKEIFTKPTSSHATCSPLVHYIHDYKSSNKNIHKPQGSKINPQYTGKTHYSELKIKRKIATPLLKITSPFKRGNMMKDKNICTPLINTLKKNNIYNQTSLQRNQCDAMQARNRNIYNISQSFCSSPAVTIYQATTLAKEFDFNSRHMNNRWLN